MIQGLLRPTTARRGLVRTEFLKQQVLCSYVQLEALCTFMYCMQAIPQYLTTHS